jgi:hypothetical protein
MSSGRMWTSCMDIDARTENSHNTSFLPGEVRQGTLVAYVIPSSEINNLGKVALKKPVSRIAFKPLRNEEDELGYGVGKMYGAYISAFREFCKKIGQCSK